jgi:hypothetical protein
MKRSTMGLLAVWFAQTAVAAEPAPASADPQTSATPPEPPATAPEAPAAAPEAPAAAPEAPAAAPEVPATPPAAPTGAPTPAAPAPEAPATAPEAPAAAPEAPATTAEAPSAPAEAPATTGEVLVVVTDPDGMPFPNVAVQVGDQSGVTDADGRFALSLPPGDYPVRVAQPGWFAPGDLVAQVAVGARTTVDVPLAAAANDVYEVVVYAPEVVGGINDSIAARRESAAVTEVIGAEQMAKSGDSNATSALARVTGLTIVDGRYVYVRGLGDRYSSTLLNLSSLPSPEPERRVVPLDLFPTGLLESVTIQKTWSPELPGEFGGGVVAMKTRGIPERPYNQVTITGGYVSQTTLVDAPTGFRGPTDWLGFGNGPRALPQALADATAQGELVEGDLFTPGFTAEELEAVGESVDAARWGVSPQTVAPDFGLQVAFGRRIETGGPQIGVFGGLTYTNGWSYDDYRQNFYDLGAGGALELQNSYDFSDLQNNILLGGLLNVGVKFTEDQAIYSTTVLTRSSTYMARTYTGYNGDLGDDLTVTRLSWVERQLLLQQLRGEHTFRALADLNVTWRYAFSSAVRDEPDQREFRYDLEDSTGQFLLSDRPEGNNLLYSGLGDTNHDARLDLTLPFGPEGNGRRGKVQAGAQAVVRDRAVDTRRFSFFERAPLGEDLRPLPPEQLFTAENIGPDGFELREVTRATDNYTATQEIQAGYVMTDLPFAVAAPDTWGLRDLSVLAGARVERSRQEVTTFELFNPEGVPVVADLETVDLLPAVTFTQGLLPPPTDPNDDAMQLRLGWARTVSRPDFRELSPAPFSEVTGGREVFGNPDLERALIDHGDLRWEWYPREGELVSVGVFAKAFQDPIETVIVPSAQLSVTWENAASALNYGVEADFRKTLFGLGSGFLDRTYVAMNGALIESRIDLGDNAGVQTSDDRALQGQSPWVLNAQVGYDNGDSKTITTVSFNVAGPRIVEVGALGAPDTLEEPVPRLDLLVQQGFAKDFYVRLRGRNLLNPVQRITQGGEVVREGRDGWTALASLEWRP